MRKEGFRNADLWLAFPADGEEREALYKLTKGEDPDGGGIFDDLGDAVGGVLRYGPSSACGGAPVAEGRRRRRRRPAGRGQGARARGRAQGRRCRRRAARSRAWRCCASSALGLLGAICLLLYLALKLVLAGAAGAAAAAARAGDAARAGVRGRRPRGVRRLGEAARAAIAAKLVYSLLLALVVVAAGALAAMPVGWFAGWLLQLCFWWGVLLKRNELTGFLSISEREGERHGASSLVRGYHNARAARAVAAGGAGAAMALPLLLGRQTRSREARPRGGRAPRRRAVGR